MCDICDTKQLLQSLNNNYIAAGVCLRDSSCLQLPVTAVAPCRPRPPLTACSGEEDLAGATWLPYDPVLNLSTLSTLVPMPSGLRGERTKASPQTREGLKGENNGCIHTHPITQLTSANFGENLNQLKLFA